MKNKFTLLCLLCISVHSFAQITVSLNSGVVLPKSVDYKSNNTGGILSLKAAYSISRLEAGINGQSSTLNTAFFDRVTDIDIFANIKLPVKNSYIYFGGSSGFTRIPNLKNSMNYGIQVGYCLRLVPKIWLAIETSPKVYHVTGRFSYSVVSSYQVESNYEDRFLLIPVTAGLKASF